MRRALRSLGTAAALGLSAVVGTGAVLTAGTVQAQVAPGWHILVYLVNDSTSDLPYGFDLDEMVAASRSGIDFTVYLDSSDASDFASDYLANTGQALIVEISDGAATVTDQLGEVDSGNPDTLGWFIATGLQRHPTERSALVVWDHGSGWQGIGFDQDVTASGDTRRVSVHRRRRARPATAAGLAAAGRDKFDLLILDACLMANFEVASETASSASYLIASEELVPGIGLDYDAFSVFATNPGADAITIFDTLADGFVQDVADLTPNQSNMTTLSLIDLGQAPALDQAMSAFTQASAADVAANAAPYMTAATAGIRYGDSGDYWPGFLDLGEYLSGLAGVGADVTTASNTLMTALDAAVIAQIGSPNYDSATGMTVYFPTEPREYDSDYDLQPTAQLWRPFLDAFYDSQAQVVVNTDIGFTVEGLSIQPAAEGAYTLQAAVTANFSGTVQLLAALPDSAGNLTYYATTPGTVDNGQAAGVVLPVMSTVSDGTNSAVPFTQYTVDGAGTHAYSQFTLQRQDGSIANLNWDRTADARHRSVHDRRPDRHHRRLHPAAR